MPTEVRKMGEVAYERLGVGAGECCYVGSQLSGFQVQQKPEIQTFQNVKSDF